jgi:sugar phosphate isomerase/epimerase
MNKLRIGLEMISVKDVSPKDLCAVISEVGKVGYEGVEFARGYFGKTLPQVKQALKDAGLVAISDHIHIDLMRKDLNKVIDGCLFLGMHYAAVLGGFDETRDITEAEFGAYTDEIRRYGEAFSRAGVRLAIHGSTAFFQRDRKGTTLFERVLAAIEPRCLHAQVDTAWALCGGEDPARFIAKFSGRMEMVHIKDFHPPMPSGDIYEIRDQAMGQDCPIGDEGIQDVPKIIEACRSAEVEWLIVEHMEKEHYDDSIAATAVSLRNIKTAMK